MPATETRLSLGNEWEFSARNSQMELRPGPGRTEITQPSGVLHEVVQHVQDRFIVEGWQFAALVQNLPTEDDRYHYLIGIFTHPSRTTLIEAWEHDVREFIKPEVKRTDSNSPDSDQFWGRFEEDDPLNGILRGANFVAEGIVAGHHGIRVGQKTLWQTGVGYFNIRLGTYEQKISDVDRQIEKLIKQVGPLQERKAALEALQSPHPVPLFQTG